MVARTRLVGVSAIPVFFADERPAARVRMPLRENTAAVAEAEYGVASRAEAEHAVAGAGDARHPRPAADIRPQDPRS